MSRLAALVLAAGRSNRMGRNKMLIPLADGRTLVETTVDRVLDAAIGPVVVVLGDHASQIRAVLSGRAVILVENGHFAEGLSSSLKAGIRAVPAGIAGVFVCLGDMPLVGGGLMRRMAESFEANPDGIVVPVRDGRRGNPVLWSRQFIPQLLEITGDTGGKRLLETYADQILEIVADDDGPLTDIDTPEALRRFQDGQGY